MTIPKMLTNLVDGKELTLSPTGLNDAADVPHLFWLEKRYKLAWPRGKYPSLPTGVDGVLKEHYNGLRAGKTQPPETMGSSVTGILHPDVATVKKFRGTKLTRVVVTEEVDGVLYGITFQGMMDEVILEPNGELSVYDAKTNASGPKDGKTEEYYGRQGNGYAFIFAKAGHRVSGKAHFAYYHPESVAQAFPGGVDLRFKTTVVTIPVSAAAAEADIKATIRLLAGPMPHMVGVNEQYDFLRAYDAKTGADVPA